MVLKFVSKVFKILRILHDAAGHGAAQGQTNWHHCRAGLGRGFGLALRLVHVLAAGLGVFTLGGDKQLLKVDLVASGSRRPPTCARQAAASLSFLANISCPGG